MNLSQLVESVRVRLGVPDSDNFFQEPVLIDLINEALQTISVEYEWPWLQTTENILTVTGTRMYEPADDWQLTKALSIEGNDAMVFQDLQQIRNWPDSVTDTPMYYTVFEEQLYLAPAPSSVYTLRHDYIRQEAPLANPSDTPFMPRQFHYAIVAMATYLAHLRSGDLPRAEAAIKGYNNWKQRMEGRRMRSSSSFAIRVRPGREL